MGIAVCLDEKMQIVEKDRTFLKIKKNGHRGREVDSSFLLADVVHWRSLRSNENVESCGIVLSPGVPVAGRRTESFQS